MKKTKVQRDLETVQRSIWDAMDWVAYKQQKFVSQFWRTESSRSRC